MTDQPESATAADGRLDHSGLAAKRVVVAVILGAITAASAVVAGASWSVAALGAEDAAAAVFVVWVWTSIAGADAAATARLARAEDASRAAAEAVLLGAGVASLLAVVFTLAQAGDAGTPGRGLLTALALTSVALAWLSVHTVFLLRYALRAHLLHAARRRDRVRPRAAGLRRLRVPGVDDRDDVPGVRHGSDRQARAPRRAAPRAHLVPVRDRDRRDHGQLGRRPSRTVARTRHGPARWRARRGGADGQALWAAALRSGWSLALSSCTFAWASSWRLSCRALRSSARALRLASSAAATSASTSPTERRTTVPVRRAIAASTTSGLGSTTSASSDVRPTLTVFDTCASADSLSSESARSNNEPAARPVAPPIRTPSGPPRMPTRSPTSPPEAVPAKPSLATWSLTSM